MLRVFNRSFCSVGKSYETVYLSGIQPTGVPHLGNYFGFIKNWVKIQNENPDMKKFLSVVDLHAITTTLPDPNVLNLNIFQMTASLLACGVDPEKTILFQQSQVPEHGQLCWILGSLQTLTQLQRLPQYKDKSKKYSKGQVPIGLVSYPVLQAADVLLYNGTHVPVGEDQSQHMNLLADLAFHFNLRYKTDFFPIPRAVTSQSPRIKSLRNPQQKMSKSDPSEFSRINISDSSDDLRTKIKRAITDSTSAITLDKDNRPGIYNLITLYSAFTGEPFDTIIDRYANSDTLGLKMGLFDVADAELKPIREQYEKLIEDKDYIWDVLKKGSLTAREVAKNNLEEIRKIVGFKN